MQKDEIVEVSIKELGPVRMTKAKNRPYTPAITTENKFISIWGKVQVPFNKPIRVRVTFIPDQGGAPFVALVDEDSTQGTQPQQQVQKPPPSDLDKRLKELEERVLRCETQLKSLTEKDVPDGMAF